MINYDNYDKGKDYDKYMQRRDDKINTKHFLIYDQVF